MDIASSLANAGNGQHDRGVSCHPSEATARVAAVILYPSLGCPLVLAPGQTRARLVIGVNASDSRRFAVDATTGLAQAAHPYIDRHLRLCPIERKPDDTDTTQGTLFGDGRTYAKARAALTTRALGPFRAQTIVHCSDGTAFGISPAGMRLYREFEGGTLYEIEFDPRTAPFTRIDASGFLSFAWMVALTPAEQKAWPGGDAPCAAHYQDLLVQRFLQAQRGTRGGAIGDLREYDVDAIGATRIGAPGADRPRLQAWHPVIRASTPTLRIAHLSDVHVNLRQQALARSRAILLEGAEGAGPLAEPFAARTLCNAFLHLRGLFEAVAPSREPDSALLLTGDLIDFNRNIDPARAGATLGEQWRALNILGNAHDADLYARWQDDMQLYSLVRHAYARLRLPVFMTTGNHEAYEMPYGISPRVGGWGMALGAMENAGRHAGPSVVERTDPALARHRGRLEEASRFSPTRANEGIAADHNLTIYEAALAYGPTYGQTYTSLNYDAANFDLFGALFNPLGDFVVGFGGPQGARTAGQLLVGLAWGEHENFQNLAGGTGSVGVDRQGAMILPRAASSFSPGQQALLRHAQQLKAASGASLLVASHFTIFSYDQGVPFSAADAGFTPADTPDGQLHSPGGLTAFNMGTCERRLRWYFDHLVLGDGPRVDWHFSGHSHRAGVYQAARSARSRGRVEVTSARDPGLEGPQTGDGRATRFVVSSCGGPIGYQNLDGELAGWTLRPPAGSVLDPVSHRLSQVRSATGTGRPRLAVALDYLHLMHPKDPPLRFVWAQRTGLLTSRRSPEVEVVLSERMAVLDCVAGVRVWVCEMVQARYSSSPRPRPVWHRLAPSLRTEGTGMHLHFSETDMLLLDRAMAPIKRPVPPPGPSTPASKSTDRRITHRVPQAFLAIELQKPRIGKHMPDWAADMNVEDTWLFPMDIGTALLGASMVDFMHRRYGEHGEIPDWNWLHFAWGQSPAPSGNLYPDPRKVIRMQR